MRTVRDDFERRRAFRITVCLPFAVHKTSEPAPLLTETVVNVSAFGIAWLGSRPFQQNETVHVLIGLDADHLIGVTVRIVASGDVASQSFWTRAEFTDIASRDRYALERFIVQVQLKRRQQHYAV